MLHPHLLPALALLMFTLLARPHVQAQCTPSQLAQGCRNKPSSAGPITLWSSHSEPFDLVWDINNPDPNGLPFNPMWAYQLNKDTSTFERTSLPDFQKICGKAFYYNTGSTSSGNNSVHADILARDCTSQHTHLDVSNSSLVGDVGGYCTGLINGHLTWMLATYTGSIQWEGWSGDPGSGDLYLDDGDYNLLLTPSAIPPGPIFDNGFTNLNVEIVENDPFPSTVGENGIGLEFKDDESVHRARGPWWRQLVNGVEHGGQPTPDAMMSTAGGDGLYGVVTGVIGIDGVHGGYTEVHPVFALALNTATTVGSGANGVRQTWVYFLRTRGNGGGCSVSQYPWTIPAAAKNLYMIQLPALKAANSLSNAQTSNWSVLPANMKIVGTPQAWAWQGGNTQVSIETVAVDISGMTYIDVQFPPGNGDFGVDGQFTVEYDFPSNSYPPPLPGEWYGGGFGGHPSGRKSGAPRRAKKKEDGFDVTTMTSRFTDPAVKAKFTTDAQNALKQLSMRPPMEAIPITVNIKTKVEPRSPGAASHGKATLSEPSIDPAKLQLNEAIRKLIETYKPQMRPTPEVQK